MPSNYAAAGLKCPLAVVAISHALASVATRFVATRFVATVARPWAEGLPNHPRPDTLVSEPTGRLESAVA